MFRRIQNQNAKVMEVKPKQEKKQVVIESTEDQPNTELIEVMRRVGDPMMTGETCHNIYNEINPVYASLGAKYASSSQLGYEARHQNMDALFTNRQEMLFRNIATNASMAIGFLLHSNELLYNLAVSNYIANYMNNSYSERKTLTKPEFDANFIYNNLVLYNMEQGFYYDIIQYERLDNILRNTDSHYANLSSIVDTAILITTNISNTIYSKVLGTGVVPEEQSSQIVNALSEIMDYVTYVLCLIKYEAICVYNNAAYAEDNMEPYIGDTQELLAFMHNYDARKK